MSPVFRAEEQQSDGKAGIRTVNKRHRFAA